MKKRTPQKLWTQAEKEYLRKHYPNQSTKELAQYFGVRLHQIYNQANTLGINKAKEYIAQTNRINQLQLIAEGKHKGYKKGRTPQNKGKKMPTEIREKVKHTWFKKGHRPHNWKPVGSRRITKEGYIEIKTKEPKKWELLHRYYWEKSFGKIPKGHVLVFKNKKQTDCRIENLELISFEKNMQRNTIQRYPKDLQSTMKLISKLNKQIKKNEQHQN